MHAHYINRTKPSRQEARAKQRRYITYYITAGDTRVNAGQRRKRVSALLMRDS
jgi:hypothetical protein